MADPKEGARGLVVLCREKYLIEVEARDLHRRVDGVEFEFGILFYQWLNDPRLYLPIVVIVDGPACLVECGVEAYENWPVIALRIDFNFRVDIFKIYIIIARDVFVIWPKLIKVKECLLDLYIHIYD